MFKHKSLAIAAAVAVGLSFAGQGAQAQTAAPTANSNATVINFFHTIPPDTEAYVKSTLLPPFQTANPDCVVNLRNLGIEGGDTLALTNTALSAKDDSSPSLYWDASSSTGAFAKAGVLADVQGFFDKNPALKSNVIDSLLTLSTYGGKIQSIPMTTNNVAVYVNVTAFKAAGVIVPSQDPTKTWTWDEFRADAKTISDFGKMKGLLFSDGGGWASWLATGWLGQAGTTFINPDGTVGFNSPEALKAYTYLQGFVADKSIAFSEPGKGWDPAPWLSQKAAMTINGPWNLSALQANKDFDWTVVPLPRGKSIAAPLGGDQLYVFHLTDAKDACAFKFATYVLSDDFQIKFTEKDGSLPVTKSATSSASYQQFLKDTPAMAGWVNQTQYGVARAAMPGFDAASTAYGDAWAKIFVQGADPQSTMDKAAADVKDLLDQAK